MIAIFTDSHFGIQNFDKDFFHYQLDFYKKQLFPYIIENNIKDCICLGDIVHHRQVMDIYIQQKLEEEFYSFFEDNNINFYVIAGNHDVYFRESNDISYLYTLKKYKNIHIIDKPTVLKIDNHDIAFAPWRMLGEFSKKCELLCGHFDIGGVPYNKFTKSTGKLKLSDFNDYETVLSGHYHIYSENKNVTYIGTPYQLDRNDYGVRKGFYTYDGKLNFIENIVSPKFNNVSYEEDGKNLKIVVDDGISEKVFTNAMIAQEYINNDFTDVYVHKYKNEALLDKFIGGIKNYKRLQNYEILEEFMKEVAVISDDIGTLGLCVNYINQLTFEDIIVDKLIATFEKKFNNAVIKIGSN